MMGRGITYGMVGRRRLQDKRIGKIREEKRREEEKRKKKGGERRGE